MALRQQNQPFYLDVTDGTRHHILYLTHNTHVMVHTDCTPIEAYYLLSGLLKGEMTYGGEAPDPGHFRCPANQSATPAGNTEAPANADSSVMSGTINADPAEPCVEDALLQSAKPSPGTGTSLATDSENDRSSMDEEESRASLAQARSLKSHWT
ncbi:g2913 [Coccomyxa elongata]